MEAIFIPLFFRDHNYSEFVKGFVTLSIIEPESCG